MLKLLDGVRVISFNHFHAGPMAAQMLADLGADVIAVEPIDGAFHRNWAVADHFVGTQSVNLLTTGRNKRSLSVDMKSAEGRALTQRLVKDADVLMENFRPGAMGRLGLGHDALKAINPRLIYASASGYGGSGPYAAKPGQDLLLQALSGLAARTGRADGPPTAVGPVVVDQHAAVIYVMSILAALFNRERTGEGRLVEVSLLQAAIDLQAESLTAWLNGARSDSPRGPAGLASWFSGGAYGIHATADGHLAISMATPQALASALEEPALAHIPDDAGYTRREEIVRLVSARLKTRTTAQWLAQLADSDVWHGPVQDYDDLQADPQLTHLETFQTVEGVEGKPVTFVMHPARFDGQAPGVARAPQPLGAQSMEILTELGYAQNDIDDLIARGVIRAAAPA
ncbi:CaiB/BaiF CoA transferase family protein [Robbsia andropogonis]|uniref:CaiB/BaiF CoA transferase family protein n=1 Tax=Robbsia andropogonis TaxID=28092 RepID=UPI0004ADB592|nr:CaiB/BaiF CoA-transferase family protein [Robbsia andropogonis]MCP1117272.1 CoA transferase [Robbsia andropogonis]MCP1129333.1 CoA transferase [Robbsia andropogonis]